MATNALQAIARHPDRCFIAEGCRSMLCLAMLLCTPLACRKLPSEWPLIQVPQSLGTLGVTPPPADFAALRFSAHTRFVRTWLWLPLDLFEPAAICHPPG
jgi:hypothetical protein